MKKSIKALRRQYKNSESTIAALRKMVNGTGSLIVSTHKGGEYIAPATARVLVNSGLATERVEWTHTYGQFASSNSIRILTVTSSGREALNNIEG